MLELSQLLKIVPGGGGRMSLGVYIDQEGKAAVD